MAHYEMAHKYFLKVFHGQTNKKEYELQILQDNRYYTNILTIQNTIFSTKVEHKKKK